ncbi:MAG TPA: helicase HerA-like domain-containing protein [Chthoniobacterales bacterium]
MPEVVPFAKGAEEHVLLPGMANRHGLIAGATGTGKTVTLRVIAERFSAQGVPVFLSDIKGDLSGMGQPGVANPKIDQRVKDLGIEAVPFAGFPVEFWDVLGEQGHPVRATVSDMGPLLLGRLLGLNEVQGGVLSLVFKIADDQGLLLLDLKDLRAMLSFAAENASQFQTSYGNVSAASVGAIQRGLLALEQQGGDKLFGEPALDLDDLMQTGAGGKGVINVLAADKLVQSPNVYATFLLWLMSELFERLPEVGDPEKPKIAFFFDEAHLLFDDAPKFLRDKIEQVVRLIRSKGVGVYFVTQNPLDVPETVLGQLGNRVQHALRSFTPRDQKAVKTAAETFRANPKLNTAEVITQLGVGEALVSLLDARGAPTLVDRAVIFPPASRLEPLTPGEREAAIKGSAIYGHYERAIDRESAFEFLKVRNAPAASGGQAGAPPPSGAAVPEGKREKPSEFEKMITSVGTSVLRAAGSQMGRTLVRGILGSIFGGALGKTSARRRSRRY